MHYPWWHVPGLTAPMLIALVAVLHIYVALYAVGGGIILAAEIGAAHRSNDQEALGYLKRHLWFFILISMVYGAVTGVGIWWTIGLASPLGTEALIHIFVFGWAIEWCFFLLEVVSAFLMYYGWDKLRPKTHTAVAMCYAWAAWGSLVVITGITAFQLNTGSWPAEGGFWRGFLNPQFVPQTLARTGGGLMLGCLYFYLHATFTLAEDSAIRHRMIQRVSRVVPLAAGLIILGGLGWAAFLPPSGKAIIEGTGAMNVFGGVVVAVTVIVFGLSFYAPYKRPQQVSRALAIGLLALGMIAIGASEFLREATRKPFVVFDYVYGHGLYKHEIAEAQRDGILRKGVFTTAHVKLNYPELLNDAGEVDLARIDRLTPEAKLDIGRTLFMYHCNDCHAERGYAGLIGLLRGWEKVDVEHVVRHPDRIHYFMPPWSGTQEEADLLIDYLLTITPPHPLTNEPQSAR